MLWAYCHVPNGSAKDMTAAIENQIERFAPGFRDLVLARAAHDTAAMERHNANLVGGDIAGGYSGLSQFVRRPCYRCTRGVPRSLASTCARRAHRRAPESTAWAATTPPGWRWQI